MHLPTGNTTMDQNEEENQWMRAVKEHNNQAAYQALYSRYRSPVLSYYVHRLRNQSQAEELFQEAFLKLYRFRESFDSAQKFSSWFWTLVKNTLFDFLRKQQRSIVMTHEFPQEDSNLNQLEEGVEWSNPELEALKNSHLKELDQLLQQLKEKDREIFLRRIFSEQKFEEIAESYQIPPASVRVSFHRTKLFLLQNLNKEGGDSLEKR